MKNEHSPLVAAISTTLIYESTGELEGEGWYFGKVRQRANQFMQELDKSLKRQMDEIYKKDPEVSQLLVEKYHNLAECLASMNQADALKEIDKFIKKNKKC